LGRNVDLMFDNITSIIGKRVRVRSNRSALPCQGDQAWHPTIHRSPTRSWATTPPPGRAWRVRAGTPAAICDKIEADTKIICQDPIVKERLAGLVAEPVGSGAADFSAYIVAERAKWGKLITDFKLRVE
jgi:tripartite-type tricarboxylate transporter receptor subunit TctC